MSNPILETERLLLEEITLSHKEDMFKMYSTPEVMRYTGDPPINSIEEMAEAIKVRSNNYKKFGYGRWACMLKENKQFIGWAGLAYLPEFDEIDLGYRFMPKYWGQGFATEASEAILAYGFEQLKIKKIIAIAMKENKASIRVMEKVGMKFDKFAPYDPGGEDVVWYSCDKQLFAQHRPLNKSI